MNTSIPVEITLMAVLRAHAARGDFYTVIQRGDVHSGLIMLVWRRRNDTQIYAQERNFNGVLGWRQVVVEVSALDGYIARACSRDPDLWVVEVETRENDFPLEGPVFTDAD